MTGLSIVIPSCNPDNFRACVAAIEAAGEIGKANEPRNFIVLVDDGDLMHTEGLRYDYARPGVKPFVFARNVNLGINCPNKEGDVLLLNDDALLKSKGGFTLMQRAAQEHPEYGIIGAVTQHTGNLNQWPRTPRHGIQGLRADPRMVCFVAVLLPRRTIDLVGLLDERFVGYGYEDNDYCRRVRQAGLKIGIHDGCFVDHGSLKPTFRPTVGGGADMSQNREIYRAKWGDLD